MPKFVASMTYDLSKDTPDDSRKLLRAELVGRRWRDRVKERLLPRNMVWMMRESHGDETTSDIHDHCAGELKAAAEAVRSMGRSCTVLRAWIQVSGGGTYGLAADEERKGSPPAQDGGG
jgi:hypothetical protein